VTGVYQMRSGAQMAKSAESLATVLSRWIRRRRLTQVQVSAASGVTRSYISSLVNGHVSRCSAETLRRLARGVATEPAVDDTPERFDQLEYEQALREMAAASGFSDLTHEPDRGALVRAIQGMGSNLQAADFWRAMIEAHPNPNPLLQQMLKLMAESQDRPGGKDVMGLLLLLSAAEPPPLETILEYLRAGLKPLNP